MTPHLLRPPQLPPDWRESIETALKRERRYAMYVDPPPSPPPKDVGDIDSASHGDSRPESLALTLVDEQEQEDATLPQLVSQPVECTQRAQLSPALARRPSQKSLPQIYRPPTPPLRAEHPKLRAAACSSTSSESVAYTLYNGLRSAERPGACASSSPYAEKAPEASRKTSSRGAGGRCGAVASGNELPCKEPAGGPSPCGHRASALSTASGSRSCSGRSYLASEVCFGVWAALKGWGLHVRAKMSHTGRY
ncbi:hypothetical protein C8Q79DRAFT_404643 [Trametes meyenii]|nr:hypothetical protein C8Q79DRAFT_404643 [Trametes meyenii]